MNRYAPVWKRLAFLFMCLAIGLAALSPLAGAPQVAHAAGSYVVDATLDAPDVANDGICSDGVGDCTLRAAIKQASEDGVPTTITFANALAGQTFVLTDTIGTLLWTGDDITVTGGANNITISGASLSVGQSIFRIEGSHNLLENLTIKDAPQDGVQVGDFTGTDSGHDNRLTGLTVFGNGASGVYIHGGGGSGGFNNTMEDNLIGAPSTMLCGSGNGFGIVVDDSATGTFIASNDIICNNGDGLTVNSTLGAQAVANTIGLSEDAAVRPNGGNGLYTSNSAVLYVNSNLISGNALDGVLLDHSTDALLIGNRIGTNPAGNGPAANGGEGVALRNSSTFATIGGPLPADRNVISGNHGSGVLLDGSGTTTNTVVGNYIGTNLSGTAAIANGQNGVRLQNLANNNTIGGHGSTDVRNLISGNSLDGVLLMSGATENYIDGNIIGLAANGQAAIPNGLAGVSAINAPNNTIGSNYVGTTQYISSNGWQGIYIGTSDNTYVGASNRIGLAADDTTPRGNGQQGVLMNESINSTIVPFSVLYNGGSGVALTGADSQNDRINPTYVAFNGGLPIDLGEDGATANDPGDGDGGPNTLLNYPVITSYAGSMITGTVCANCTVLIYVAYGNPAGNYGGGFYIQSAAANGAGQWSAALIGGLRRIGVSLVACQSPCGLASNTSEMSPRPQLFLPLARR